MPSATRRSFLKHSAVGAAALAVPASAPAAGRADRLPVALIGCGGMGGNHLRLLAAHKDVEVRAVCDVDAGRLDRRFDSAKEAVLGDDEAHAMLRRKYRDGHWAVPKGV